MKILQRCQQQVHLIAARAASGSPTFSPDAGQKFLDFFSARISNQESFVVKDNFNYTTLTLDSKADNDFRNTAEA